MRAQTQSPSLKQQIQKIEILYEDLIQKKSIGEKLQWLNKHPLVTDFFSTSPLHSDLLQSLDQKEEYVVKAVIAIGQGKVIFHAPLKLVDIGERFRWLVQQLLQVEEFYDVIGGIVGYHLKVLRLIDEQDRHVHPSLDNVKYLQPLGMDLAKDTPEVRATIRNGIELLHEIAEIFPVGGAGDRLNLTDERTGRPLPAALLKYGGHTLFEGLVRDLQALEYLHYRLTGRHVTTPIAAMTSLEKNNHGDILALCESRKWFGRPRESMRFFTQPLTPVITREGNWSLAAPMTLTLKPGGHGVIWKLAKDHGIFTWFSQLGRHKAIVRQINNPLAGTDSGILALAGIGCGKHKVFGFAACNRIVNSAEGTDILVEAKVSDGYQYCVSNIEYVDFHNRGVSDCPAKPGGNVSLFPANTNILFADLDAVQEAIKKNPLPGMLVNLKHQFPFLDPNGGLRYLEGSRLETTMQNISDSFTEKFDHQLTTKELAGLKTFVTFNDRRKTISVTKKTYAPGKSLLETPEGVLYDLLHNMQDLLVNYCGFDVPENRSVEEYLRHGPRFIAWFHPAMGPLYSVIGQKLRRGQLGDGSELVLEIAEVDMEELIVQGSFIVQAHNLMGAYDKNGILHYGEQTGKCHLRRVRVVNKGIDTHAKNIYWKNEVHHEECLKIRLEGNAEFFAEDVVIEGNHEIVVPDGHRMVAFMRHGRLAFRQEKISQPTWYWKYSFTEDDRIVLQNK